jgi:hypothetical protein
LLVVLLAVLVAMPSAKRWDGSADELSLVLRHL